MYTIIYDVTYLDANGRMGHSPDYLLGFKTTDPSGASMDVKEAMGKMSVESKNPGFKVISIKVVREGYL